MAKVKLTGKVAVITGSSRGIGKAIAIDLAKQGVSIVLNGRNQERLDEISKRHIGVKNLITLGVDSRNLILLPDATYAQMKQAIVRVQNLSYVEGGKAEIIFYYSGHGLPDETTKEGYLMPVDVSGNNVSFSNMFLHI